VLYTTAKLGQLGLIRGLYQLLGKYGIRTAVLTPPSTDNTSMRAADTILDAVTGPNLDTSGACYFFSDDGAVQTLSQENLYAGVYGELNNRLNKVYGFKPVTGAT
jgi:NAD(P)-dependent dehydrogenase (short-subunit alcohol dehydrogenase family)